MPYTTPKHSSTRVLVLVGAALLFGVACTAEGEGGQRLEPDSGAADGSHEVSTQSLSEEDVDGFGGGTVYYPDDKEGQYPVIAAAPGQGADESMVTWFGELLASNGFVIVTMNTLSTGDSTDARAPQILAALDYVAFDSAVAAHADAESMGVLGHSMGGGGAMVAAAERPDIKATVATTPHAPEPRDWSSLTSPTLIIGGATDPVTPTEEHAEPLYDELDNAKASAYMNLQGDHFVASEPSEIVSQQVLAWFKLFLAADTDFADELCPPPDESGGVVEYRDSCPHV